MNTDNGKAFWVGTIVFFLVFYWVCLRFLQPGYFSPLSPYHIDFYDYAGMVMQPASLVVTRYPRPVAFLGMKLFGFGGLDGFMAGAIGVAIANFLLTIAYVRRLFRLNSLWVLAPVAVYLLLNVAHPDFYFEHRHDFPAQVSYFFLMVSLLGWQSWIAHRRLGVLVLTLVSAVGFAFSKETYFLSALLLVGALAVVDRSLSCASSEFFGLSRPRGGFQSAVDATHQESFCECERGGRFYLSDQPGPGLGDWDVLVLRFASAVSGAGWCGRVGFDHCVAESIGVRARAGVSDRGPGGSCSAFDSAEPQVRRVCVVGRGAFPRADCVGRFAGFCDGRVKRFECARSCGSGGYRAGYQSTELRWMIERERVGGALVRSFDAMRAVRPPARILVSGLDDPSVPWQVADFMRSEFGDEVHWTVVFPRDVQFRRKSRVVTFADGADVRFEGFRLPGEVCSFG